MLVRRSGVGSLLIRTMASQNCWRAVFGLFLLEALWIACSAAYPMAFDEQFHFGLIQLHAKQWLPFFTSQPPTGAYGAVVRDPSYLYHWLMSFPYRSITLFFHNQTTEIIFLRVINVALFAGALLLYRRLFRRLRLSEAFINCSLLVLILIPIVPFLAATINYDNLLILVIPLCILLTLDVLDSLRVHHLSLAKLAVLLSVLLLGSLVKYPFLPIPVVIGVFVAVYIWKYGLVSKKVWCEALAAFRAQSTYQQLLLITLLMVSLGLFGERYAINIVRYHSPVSACTQVVSKSVCQQYGPWARDDTLKQAKLSSFRPNIVVYSGEWLSGMWYRLFFAIGPAPGYDTQPPLYLISRLVIGVAILSTLGIIVRYRAVLTGHPERLLLLLLTAGYGAVLFGDNYLEYAHTAQSVAINGRYWIPFLPLFFALTGFAWSSILRHRPTAKLAVASVILAAFLLQGGGTMTFIVDSNDNWYWPNTTVRRINADVRSAAQHIIYRG
jgi:hypothetical protein